MSISDELTNLRLNWRVNGVPRDAHSKISAVLGRHVGTNGRPPQKQRTEAELERCGRCRLPRVSHDRLARDCPGQFSLDENSNNPDPGWNG